MIREGLSIVPLLDQAATIEERYRSLPWGDDRYLMPEIEDGQTPQHALDSLLHSIKINPHCYARRTREDAAAKSPAGLST